jgi:4-hydroxy-tetrahydrodipicolinate synthase
MIAAERRLEMICGSAERHAPFYMLAGAGGFTTGAGNVCPHVSLAMHAALAAGEYREGLELQKILLPIEDYRARAGDSYNVSMLKHAMRVLGQDFGEARPPQRRLSESEKAEIAALVEPILRVEKALAREVASVGLM